MFSQFIHFSEGGSCAFAKDHPSTTPCKNSALVEFGVTCQRRVMLEGELVKRSPESRGFLKLV